MSLLTKCAICNEQKEHGIQVVHAFICDECEKDIVTTDTSSPTYKIFVEKLKSINTREEEIVK